MKPSAPPRDSRRRPWTRAEFAALDFETTGLDLARDHVISFGVVPVRGGEIILGEGVHQLVRPPIPPSPSSVLVHQLRTQDLAEAPTLEEARIVLRDALSRRFILVWYAPVELAFLRRMFGPVGGRLAARCIDVRKLVVAVRGPGATERSTGSLSECAARYGVPVAAAHEAYDDALVTAQLFLVLASRMSGRDGPTAGELLRAGR